MPKEKFKKEKICYIYKIHFLCGFPTGRYYLGKHKGYIDDAYGGSGEFCRRYYKKYGKINGKTYIKEILEINPDVETNRVREILVIGDKWKTDPLCMNLKPGGDGHDEMSNFNKERLAETNYKAVKQYSLSGDLIAEFNSIKEASISTNISHSKISACCTKSRYTAGGFIWRYKNDELLEDEIELINKNCKIKSAAKRPVYRIDINSGEKVWYESIREAARQINGHNSSISEVCLGKRKTADGYKWKFAEEN